MGEYEVLVVEDNLGDQMLIRKGFEEFEASCRLHVTEDGQEATDFLLKRGRHNRAPRPQLIVLDLNLAKKDGREVLAEVKRDVDLRTIPVVVFTTSRRTGDIEECYRRGANAYLTKPLELTEFLDSVKSIGEFWLRKATPSL